MRKFTLQIQIIKKYQSMESVLLMIEIYQNN